MAYHIDDDPLRPPHHNPCSHSSDAELKAAILEYKQEVQQDMKTIMQTLEEVAMEKKATENKNAIIRALPQEASEEDIDNIFVEPEESES